ncbi:MAG TPA: HI1506-related protein [Nevskiales bacterium]|nr:HI1506-related protein [Nevskiales bacterium]
MAKVLRITSKRDGFRRGGIAHSTTPTDHPIDRFTKEQLAAIKTEPMLTVEEIDDGKKASGDADKGDQGKAGKGK